MPPQAAASSGRRPVLAKALSIADGDQIDREGQEHGLEACPARFHSRHKTTKTIATHGGVQQPIDSSSGQGKRSCRPMKWSWKNRATGWSTKK